MPRDLRLDAEESAALTYAREGVAGEAWLFGSRTDPQRRGGDVDVLVLTEASPYEVSQRVATRFFSRCEERIDVIVMNPNSLTLEQQAFLDHIHRVRLN
ncbi:MAG: nucleotidyltransferase domain-containing protein [Rhodocyclaceae bacterium]|nr:nucleotidyltransferase domain-containing protein [Rhodocyclaceae bacterium]